MDFCINIGIHQDTLHNKKLYIIMESIISPLMSKEIGDSNCCILKTVLKNNIMDVDKINPITHGLMPFKKPEHLYI